MADTSFEKIVMVFQADTQGLRVAEPVLERTAKSVERIAKGTRDSTRATERATYTKKNYAMAVMGVGYALEDMNYGIQNSMNNLSMIAMAMGWGGAAVVGTQIFAAAGVAVARNWDALSKTLGVSSVKFNTVADDVSRLKDKLDELRKAAKDNAEAFSQLPDAEASLLRSERIEQRRQAIVTASDPDDSRLASGMAGVFANEDMAAMARDLGRVRQNAGMDYATPEQKAKLEDQRRLIADRQASIEEERRLPDLVPGVSERRISGLEAEIADLNLKKLAIERAIQERGVQEAQRDLAAAMTGNAGAVTTLERDILPGVGRNDLVGPLRRARKEAADSKLKGLAARALGGPLMAAIDEVRKVMMPGMPGMTLAQEAQGGAQFQANMEGAGASAEEQANVAGLFTGKDAKARLAKVPFFVNAMRQAGATQREILQAMPEFINAVEGGQSPFTAAQKIINRLTKNGLDISNRGNRMNFRDQMMMGDAATGASMLGIMPNNNPEAMSRFTANPMDATWKEVARANDRGAEAAGVLADALETAMHRGIPLTLRRRGG